MTDGTYDSLMIADDTMAWKEAFWDSTYGGGRDILTLSITSVTVTVPAKLALPGAGLACVGLIHRRRRWWNSAEFRPFRKGGPEGDYPFAVEATNS